MPNIYYLGSIINKYQIFKHILDLQAEYMYEKVSFLFLKFKTVFTHGFAFTLEIDFIFLDF